MPPDMRALDRFAVSVGGIPVLRPLAWANRDFRGEVITHYWQELTSEQHDDPWWDPENPTNFARYEAAFQQLFDKEIDEPLGWPWAGATRQERPGA